MSADLSRVLSAIRSVIRGKDDIVQDLLMALLAQGHVLLEDAPGTGKTTLAKALARSLDMRFSRIQFTPDLLPTDLLGNAVLDPRDGSFTFHEGPVFTHLLLADEINRASPRTQSALLEAMNESQVTIDNNTRMLPAPFFVVATQNPSDFHGTYPLPEAQLDRFLIRLSLGYPQAEAELQLLLDRQTQEPLDALVPLLSAADVLAWQEQVRHVRVEEDIARYIIRLMDRTREHADIALGASPRASLNLFRASQAQAYLSSREYVIAADVQALFFKVVAHRIRLTRQASYSGRSEAQVLREILDTESVPA
ncbi:MAG: MoxR family ATPase [Myxococcales bacterium]|jgi:MoxR-like ATPase|nr:MoxR family ATPase [Myxococcales bacterium]